MSMVPPSPSIIARPPEEIDESHIEQWLAINSGGFQRCDDDRGVHRTVVDTVRQISRTFSRVTLPKSRAPIRKRKAKKPVEYFVNHCENTACTFPHGHTGLCSHQLVSGKRGGRSTRGYLRLPSPYFDLNDSD